MPSVLAVLATALPFLLVAGVAWLFTWDSRRAKKAGHPRPTAVKAAYAGLVTLLVIVLVSVTISAVK